MILSQALLHLVYFNFSNIYRTCFKHTQKIQKKKSRREQKHDSPINESNNGKIITKALISLKIFYHPTNKKPSNKRIDKNLIAFQEVNACIYIYFFFFYDNSTTLYVDFYKKKKKNTESINNIVTHEYSFFVVVRRLYKLKSSFTSKNKKERIFAHKIAHIIGKLRIKVHSPKSPFVSVY